MVRVIGYYVVFVGHPETRRASIRLSVQAGIEVIAQYIAKGPVLIKGNVYRNGAIDAIEKITTTSEHDVQRALRDGYGAITEEELKALMQSTLAPGGAAELGAGTDHKLLS